MTRAPIVICVAALLFASPARAQSASAEDRAAADALYTQAGELLKANRFAEACPKLETSQRLDPGIGTLIRLGFCYENLGRTASAWSAYLDAEALARRAGDKRADDAAGRAKAVEPKLSRLSITPASPAPGFEVRRDGKPMDPGLWGSAVPMDPGEHTIEASAPGRRPWSSKVMISGEGTTATTEVPPLAEGPRPPFWTGQRIAGVTVAGVGLVSLAVGTAFGVQTLGKTSDAKAYCSATLPYCVPAGVTLENDAKTMAKVADATLALGGAAVVAGLVVFLIVPAAKQPTTGAVQLAPVVGVGQVGLSAAGRW